MIKERKQKTNQIVVYNNGDSCMLAKDKETNESYRSYFDKVLDQYHLERLRGEKHGSVYDTRGHKFQLRRKSKALKLRQRESRMELGAYGMPIKTWNCSSEIEMSSSINEIKMTTKIKDEWRNNILVPISNKKGDIQHCNNCKGIEFMTTIKKQWENRRIIGQNLRIAMIVSQNPFGIMIDQLWKQSLFRILSSRRMPADSYRICTPQGRMNFGKLV